MFDKLPGGADALHEWLREHLALTIPREAIVPGHSAPFEYLSHSFFEHDQPRDALVWANRGGGKTFLGALATALDLAFKPEIEIRILAGSLEQAGRMHEHLRNFFSREPFAKLVEGKMTDKRLRLTNGSRVELLAASQASVRGTRVQKLRCDEVDLFDPKIWEAAQLVTRSAQCGNVFVPGSVECISTMHQPFGMMSRLVKEAESGSRRLFNWGVVDVLERCGDERECTTDAGDCELLPECDGSAKARAVPGHISVSDAITMKRRVALPVWNAEMLSLEPRRTDCVFPEFNESVHVVTSDPPSEQCGLLIAGMDFGFRAPTAILWGQLTKAGEVVIVAERVERETVIAHHARAIVDGPLAGPAWIGVDPAGRQRSDQTGQSNIQILKEHGLHVRARPSRIAEGIALVSARLKPAAGEPTLRVHVRCRHLIEALQQYHYPTENPGSMEPVKDGPDHAVDALRYMIVNLDSPHASRASRYRPSR
ncbi:MAG: hypothetical protein KDA31_00325 [Phycisphaerales bacterium]|nr:hypothetical protein [Phycisphaerales bacterium]MCB9835992.1 hypothetical protein [Phycisphaera sp.]